MAKTPVVIVGGGASGLSTAGALHHHGIDSVILEQDQRIGGTWARRYDRLHLHTVRRFSGLAYYPISSKYSHYPSRDEFVAYLNEYARHFQLKIENGCQVRNVRLEADNPLLWRVATAKGDWRGPVVVIAAGQYGIPILPDWPGREVFRGDLVHSSRYVIASPYRAKRVLVVGMGNSGAEIVTDLLDGGASYVALSIRTSPSIVPRDPFGVSVQRTGLLLNYLPTAIADWLAQMTSRLVLGDLTRYGLPPAGWKPYSSSRVPVIDVGFANVLKRGLVQIRPALRSLSTEGAVFADGSAEPFDAIIAATGFNTGLDELVEPTGILGKSHEPIAPSGEPTSKPGLYFMGYTHSLRGHLFEANVASRKLARNIERYLKELEANCAAEIPGEKSGSDN